MNPCVAPPAKATLMCTKCETPQPDYAVRVFSDPCAVLCYRCTTELVDLTRGMLGLPRRETVEANDGHPMAAREAA